jgi:hypothetical protein
VAVTGTTPDKVTTDKHASYPPAELWRKLGDDEVRKAAYRGG